MTSLRSLFGLSVVVVGVLLSIASSDGTGGGDSSCGPLQPGALEGEACEVRSDCAEVCCFCEGSDRGFRANGCNLDESVCYGGDQLCQLALDEDPSLCDSGDGGP